MAKYITQEILIAAGYKPEDVLDKVSVRIGGINVSKPTHVINLQDADTVEVKVGAEEPKTVDLKNVEGDSAAVKAELKAKVPAVEVETEVETPTEPTA